MVDTCQMVCEDFCHNELSNTAFIYADAMLAARNQNTTDQ